MQRTESEDKRIFARFPVEFPARFLCPSTCREGYCEAQDISAKGVGIVTHEALSPNSSIELWLHIPDKGDSLYTRGEVVWAERLEPNRYKAGINLDKADLMGMSRVLRTI